MWKSKCNSKDGKIEEKGKEKEMTEDRFWKIIGLLDWTKEGDNDAVLRPAVDKLSQFSEIAINRFHDILSEKLFLLDGEKYARYIGENAYGGDDYFSADIFLYARCCAVANGKKRFGSILQHPEKMIKNLTFEPLLALVDKAYLKKTGHHTQHIPAFNYETFFNSEGWGREKPILLP